MSRAASPPEQYRVEELANAAGVTVDTVRFYQGKRLLPPPRRKGRVAWYGPEHLERLRRTRSLLAERFTLAQIAKLFASEEAATSPRAKRSAADASGDASRALLEALVAESVGDRTLTRAELAAESKVPEPLLAAAQQAGLIAPIEIDGAERFTRADAELARAGLDILARGLPLKALLDVAVAHAERVEATVDQAISLFDAHVLEPARGVDGGDDDVAEAFRALLPEVARMVALHFQRTLVARALERLRSRGDRRALEQALVETQSAHLEVSWRR